MYYFVDRNNFLQQLNLIQADSDISVTEDSDNFLIHVDNWTTVTGGTYSADTKLTTFTNKATWIPSVTGTNTLVLVDTETSAPRIARYAVVTLTGNTPDDDFTVPGDWSTGTFYIGYLYDYQVDFPKIYTTKQAGQSTVADVTASLVIHRLNLSLGQVGLYQTILTRVGKDTYTDTFESTPANQYDVSDVPYLAETIKTIPVYDKTDNVDITLKSTHPSPCTLRSLSWEGDYSPKFYRRQ